MISARSRNKIIRKKKLGVRFTFFVGIIMRKGHVNIAIKCGVDLLYKNALLEKGRNINKASFLYK